MYVGWALLHLGFGLVGGSAWVLGTFPAAIWLVHRQVLHEERDLGEAFPDEFARYRAAVPRYLPTRRLSPGFPGRVSPRSGCRVCWGWCAGSGARGR
jgi:hypothetical protein